MSCRLVVGTYHQVGDENLQNLGLQARSAGEQLLEDGDQDVSERRSDEGAVNSHLGHARGNVVAVLGAVVRDPGREDFLKSGERAGSEHLGAQRVRLELLEVGLPWSLFSIAIASGCFEVAFTWR